MESLGSAVCFAGIFLLKSGYRKYHVDSRHDTRSMLLVELLIFWDEHFKIAHPDV